MPLLTNPLKAMPAAKIETNCRTCGEPIATEIECDDAELAQALARFCRCASCVASDRPAAQTVRPRPRRELESVRLPYADN